MALGDCHHHDASGLRQGQRVEKVCIVSRSGTAAEAFQDQALCTAVERRLQQRGAKAGYQWQYGDRGDLF
ncbi:hypothetical protein D3C84_1297210 [compost metagenome]